MAYTQIPGVGPLFPASPDISLPPAFSNALLIDATGEKIAMSGCVWFPGRSGTKNISRIHVLPGTVVSAGGSGVTFSLQDPDTTAGPPTRPDGAQDQTVAALLSSMTTDTWFRSNTLSATRTVSCGDKLSVVVEYDGSGRLGADSLILKGLTANNSGHAHRCHASLFTTSWAVQPAIPNVLLEFDDGTFGTLIGAFPCSDTGTIAFNSGSTPDENALQFQYPFPCKVDGGEVIILGSGTADFDVVLYDSDGTTVLASTSVSGRHLANTAGRRLPFDFSAEVTLLANTTYYLAVKPTTANNVTVYYFDVNANGHLSAHFLGTTGILNSQTNGGGWGAGTNTRRIFAGLRLSSLSDGAGGMLVHTGMTGGMQG